MAVITRPVLTEEIPDSSDNISMEPPQILKSEEHPGVDIPGPHGWNSNCATRRQSERVTISILVEQKRKMSSKTYLLISSSMRLNASSDRLSVHPRKVESHIAADVVAV